MSRGWLVVAVLTLCAVAGCTVAGSPIPTPEQPASARPREVRLDGIDPCTLLTEEQKKQLGLTERSVLSVSKERIYKGETRLCSTRGEQPRAIAVGVTLVVTAGIGLFTPDAVEGTLSPRMIRGFPALLLVPRNNPEFCMLLVDVADGQLLDVQFRDGGGRPAVPQSDLCAGVEQAADLAMETLLSR